MDEPQLLIHLILKRRSTETSASELSFSELIVNLKSDDSQIRSRSLKAIALQLSNKEINKLAADQIIANDCIPIFLDFCNQECSNQIKEMSIWMISYYLAFHLSFQIYQPDLTFLLPTLLRLLEDEKPEIYENALLSIGCILAINQNEQKVSSSLKDKPFNMINIDSLIKILTKWQYDPSYLKVGCWILYLIANKTDRSPPSRIELIVTHCLQLLLRKNSQKASILTNILNILDKYCEQYIPLICSKKRYLRQITKKMQVDENNIKYCCLNIIEKTIHDSFHNIEALDLHYLFDILSKNMDRWTNEHRKIAWRLIMTISQSQYVQNLLNHPRLRTRFLFKMQLPMNEMQFECFDFFAKLSETVKPELLHRFYSRIQLMKKYIRMGYTFQASRNAEFNHIYVQTMWKILQFGHQNRVDNRNVYLGRLTWHSSLFRSFQLSKNETAFEFTQRLKHAYPNYFVSY